MAGNTTTYFEAGRSWGARVAERNAELLAQQALRAASGGAHDPEFYFPRHIDNSRLVKAPDPGPRARDAHLLPRNLHIVHTVMSMVCRHFSAIEGGLPRRVGKADARPVASEENASAPGRKRKLTQPGRIDTMARQLGLAEPQPGQVIHPNARPDVGAPANGPRPRPGARSAMTKSSF